MMNTLRGKLFNLRNPQKTLLAPAMRSFALDVSTNGQSKCLTKMRDISSSTRMAFIDICGLH
jgi:hypothetical protein